MDRSVSLLGLALVLGCTAKPCDETKLAAIADAIQERSVEARDARNAAIVDACPKLPTGLARSLELSFATGFDWEGPSRFDDPEYVELRATTCPFSGDEWQQALLTDERDAAIFEICELDRYGLLGPNEPFVFEDLSGFELYEWLTARKIDAELARRIARGLMTVESRREELMAMCHARDVACRVAYERYGVTLPRSTSTFDSVGYAGTELRILDDGDVSTQPGVAGVVLIAADATAPWGVIVEPAASVSEISAAMEDGPRVIQLLVLRNDEPRAIPVSPGPLWAPMPETDEELRPPPVVIVFGRHAIELRQGDAHEVVAASGDCTSAAKRCVEPASLGPALDRFRQATPRNSTAELRIAPMIAYQQVIWLLELVRGEGCYSREQDDVCVFPDLVVDASPPLYRNMYAKISFGEPRTFDHGRKRKLPRVGPSSEAALASFEAKREQLLECVLADHDFVARLDTHPELGIGWGPAPRTGTPALAVFPRRSDDFALQACVARVFDVASVEERLADFVVGLDIELAIPIRLEPGSGR